MKADRITLGLAIAGLTCISSAFVLLSSVVRAENSLLSFCTFSVLLVLYWADARAEEYKFPCHRQALSGVLLYLDPAMTKSFNLLLIACLFLTLASNGQSPVDNAYLLRKLIDKDSSVKIPNTGVWILENAGLKKEHFGWLLEKEFTKIDGNMLYFEMNTTDVPDGSWRQYAPGSVQLAINLPNSISSLNLDTISKLDYQLINNYTGFAWKEKPTNTLSGIISIKSSEKNEKIINGTLNIDTKNPLTEQRIVFDNFLIPTLTLDQYLANQREQKILKQKQEQKMWGAYDLVSKERSSFYDSIFNLKKYPNNKLTATINTKTKFDFQLDNSYILTNASLTDSAKHDLTELLGGNILASVQGDKKVFVFHSFYDPVKNAIDDETNYSLNIELDSIVTGKTYKTKEFIAKLAFWHYGPGGAVITSKKVGGSITITENNSNKSSGVLALNFKNTDKTKLSIVGTFELPKINLGDISDLENRIKIKLIKYYNEE